MEDATKDWTNVNKFDYSIGDSSSTLGYSQCDSYSSCTGRTYGLTKTDVNVRILTIQELYEASGNKVIDRPHAYGGEMPLWAFNYLGNSISGGGTVNDTYTRYSVSSPNGGYWLMNSKDNSNMWFVNGNQGAAGILSYTTDVPSAYSGFGARAVVEINK